VPRLRINLCRLLLPLLGAAALWLTGCADKEGLNSTIEVDEPGYREGQSLLKTGRKQEALNAFLKVIIKRGDDAPDSHLEVGLLYLQHINDPLSAIYHFKRYLALRPNGPQAPLVKQRIDAAIRDFARTLPARPIEGQPQRVDLVATLDRLKQENDSLKQELADLKSSRPNASLPVADLDAPIPAYPPSDETPANALTFKLDTVPAVRVRPTPTIPLRPGTPASAAARVAPATATPAPAQAALAAPKPGTPRRHIVRPGDNLFKLAQQYYGNRSKWRDIFAANRGVMKNETDLKAGMELKIP